MDAGTGGVITTQDGVSMGSTKKFSYISYYNPQNLYITFKQVTVTVPNSAYAFEFYYNVDNYVPLSKILNIMRTPLVSSIVSKFHIFVSVYTGLWVTCNNELCVFAV